MGSEFAHILDSLGWAVLHSTWQGGFALLVVIVWRFALRGRSPALRHAGQLAAMIGCLIAFLWTFAIYVGASPLPLEGGATLSGGTGGETQNVLTGLIAPFDPTAIIGQAGFKLSRITQILACLWALGFAAMSLRYAFAFGQVQQLRVLGVSHPDAGWQARFSNLLKQSHVSKHVQLLISTNVAGPMTLGLIKPIVLVPVGFLSGLPADQVEAVLLHELAHIRRYDYALNLVQTAVKTVLFFHPAIHVIAKWADRDREQACDDLAVRQGRDPLSLVRGLAALRLQATPTLGLAATGTNEATPFLARITRLTGQTQPRSQMKGRPEHVLISLLSVLLLGSVYVGSTSSANAHPVPPTAPALPDTIVSVPPSEPVPPVPPALPKLNLDQFDDEREFQSFIDADKAIYKNYAKSMAKYEDSLAAYIESAQLDEDELKDMVESYEDFAEEIEDLFEDRREAIEDRHEDYTEARVEGLESAQKALAKKLKKLDKQSVQYKATEQARKEIEREIKREYANADRQRDALERYDENVVRAKEQQARAKEQQQRAKKQQARAAEQQQRAKAQQVRAWEQQQRAKEQQARAHASVKTAEKHAAKAYKHAQATKAKAESSQISSQRHEEFRDVVMRELLNDKLIQNANETVFLSHPDNVMSLNGNALASGLRGKYCELLDAYGFQDNRSEITITPKSLTILTDWKNGSHKTQITYGTFED